MALPAPPVVPTGPVGRIRRDLRIELARSAPLPPGELGFSLARTRAFVADPLGHLLDAYARYGPVFTLRILHTPVVFLLGPQANHFVLVSGADHFSWRGGGMAELIPLLGDGLLTTDGAPHRQARRILLPAFHRERIAASAEVVVEEAERAVAALVPGRRVDLYDWTRRLALRIALRALFGLDPETTRRGVDLAEAFERALGFFSRDYALQFVRGPGSPYAQMQRARRELDAVLAAEIARRRAAPEGDDLLALLLEARGDDGTPLSDPQVRDQVMTLLFAGHDTTTSTLSFLVYELARHPEALACVQAELDSVLGARPPAPGDLMSGLPELEQAVDETLRLYPPAWVGPRRAVRSFTFAGHHVPAGVLVNYCSWASHRLPDVWPNPDAFQPARFAPAARAALPKGAYVPFGGGSRTCIGMRFGQLEVAALAAALLRRYTPELEPGYELRIRQMPTLSPRDGLPVALRAR